MNSNTVLFETVIISEAIKIYVNDPSQIIAQALAYRTYGLSIVPVGPNKVPIIAWKEYQTRHATEEEIRKWWHDYPNAQIGIVTGAISGLVVVDVEYGGNFEGFPITPTAKTGGGGRHYYFKHPGQPVANSVRIRELTDIRGDGGYVVAPPSRSEKGAYEWLLPWNTALADLPAWVQQEQEMVKDTSEERDWTQIYNGNVLEGMRNMTGVQVAGKLLHEIPEDLWSLGWGLFITWNTRLPKPMAEKELRGIWKSIATAEKKRRKKESLQPVKLPPRMRIAKCPPPSKVVTFQQWADTISMNFPDLRFASEVALSTVSQFLIKDITNPFALVLVDVPSSGKTICINFFDQIPELTYATDKFTPASFVSNAANVPKEMLAEVDLLPRIQYRMFLIRDFATLFSKREEDLNELLGILTRVLDGEGLNTDSGVHGQRQYNGEYLFMLLGASTPIPPRVMKVMGNLGSRIFFLSINSNGKTEEELAAQIADQSYKDKEKTCRLATQDFLYGLWNTYPTGIDWDRKGDDIGLTTIIARCAKLLASLRGVINVWQDDFNNEFKYGTPVVERPDRVNQLFYNLARGHALVCGRTQIASEDLKAIVELCVDGAPAGRAKLFKKLIEHGGGMDTSEIEKELNCSKPTAVKEMKTLQILGVCTLREGVAKDNRISLSDEFRWFMSDECLAIRGLLSPLIETA